MWEVLLQGVEHKLEKGSLACDWVKESRQVNMLSVASQLQSLFNVWNLPKEVFLCFYTSQWDDWFQFLCVSILSAASTASWSDCSPAASRKSSSSSSSSGPGASKKSLAGFGTRSPVRLDSRKDFLNVPGLKRSGLWMPENSTFFKIRSYAFLRRPKSFICGPDESR